MVKSANEVFVKGRPKTVHRGPKIIHKSGTPAVMTIHKRHFIHYVSFIPAGWKTLWNIIS
jgi:hypothetical protein